MSLQASLMVVMNHGYKKYRGVNIHRTKDGYEVMGRKYITEYLAKKKVDLAYIKFNTHKIFK